MINKENNFDNYVDYLEELAIDRKIEKSKAYEKNEPGLDEERLKVLLVG